MKFFIKKFEKNDKISDKKLTKKTKMFQWDKTKIFKKNDIMFL